MIDPAIITYIKTQLRAGSSQKDISIALAKQGWSALAIAQHFEEVYHPPQTEAQAAEVPKPQVDNPLAYEKLHPQGASEVMPAVVQATPAALERPPVRKSVGSILRSGYIVAPALGCAALCISYLVYISIRAHLTGAMLASSYLLIAQIIESIDMRDLMPLGYLLPLPIMVLVIIFTCRYIGVKIARAEARPYLGFFYGAALYVSIAALALALLKIALDFYISEVPLPVQASTALLYASYYFSIAGICGVGLGILMLLMLVGIVGASQERTAHPRYTQFMFRYFLITLTLAGGVYLTNILYRPIQLIGRAQLCYALYDPVVRGACRQELMTPLSSKKL